MYVFDSWRDILVPSSPSCPSLLFYVYQLLFCTGVDIPPSLLPSVYLAVGHWVLVLNLGSSTWDHQDIHMG